MKKNVMKRILSMTLATIISLSLCVPAFAIEQRISSTEMLSSESMKSHALAEPFGTEEQVLVNEIFEISIPVECLETVHAKGTIINGYIIVNTQVIVSYFQTSHKLKVYIKHYTSSLTFGLLSSIGTIRVVDIDSNETIISAEPFTMISMPPLIGSDSIDTTTTINNIGLYSGERISVTVAGAIGGRELMQYYEAPFTQIALCII